jgi:Thermostable hemolysin
VLRECHREIYSSEPSSATARVAGTASRLPRAPRFAARQIPSVRLIDDLTGRRLILVRRRHPLRASVEACIRSVYERAFAARNPPFADTLIALLDDVDQPLCAAGLRTAADGFFSEIYLDDPIERVLSQRLGQPVRRPTVFEVTTLASRSSQDSAGFIRTLASVGEKAGFGWCFFTASTRLRSLLQQLGIAVIELSHAKPDRLPDADSWGNYYAHSPKVCAVSGPRPDAGVVGRGGTPSDA